MEKKPLSLFSKVAEDAVIAYWKENNISFKARHQNASSKKKFYLMDGPPYATGAIHMGTALNKTLKDVAMRFKRAQGFDVFDRPGYDTHGVPIEKKVEQKLGFSSKTDIEKFGVEKFVRECKAYASQYIPLMNEQFEDLGVWMDWENPYITFQNEYIEAVWWTFKKADEKGLLHLGLYPVHVCPSCETAVSFNEIEYTKQTDASVYVKFKVSGKPNTFLVIWTTTPWTLPANTGVMVHPKFRYVEVSVGTETWIVAKERCQPLMDALEAGYSVTREFDGKELDGVQYENPLTPHLKLGVLENAYRVILSERYVHLEDGTGLVHCAPGHGKEDFDAGSRAGLPAVSPVALDGSLKPEAGKYAGKKARAVDAEIISDLKDANALVYSHAYTHDYPVCWRDKTPLLMMSIPQWFFKISKIQPALLKENASVTWVPKRMQARMQNWLEGIGDWPVSRSRYWGTPLPIWVCEKCEKRTVVGSLKELAAHAKIPNGLDLHKPYVDAVTISCKCGGVSRRVPFVLDVWFDSGVSSWAALQYPEKSDLFKRFWPADLNIEGTDQFRGWWNSQLICSEIVFGKKSFEAVSVHGLVLDLGKKKMSKSLGNITSPMEVVEKFSRDYLRYYLARESKGDDFIFDWDAFDSIHKFFSILSNSYNFVTLFSELDWKTCEQAPSKLSAVEDVWLVSRTNALVRECTDAFESLEFFRALNAIESFVVSDVSRTYIKLVRERAKDAGAKQVSEVLGFALFSVLRLLAPVVPHVSDHFYLHARKAKIPESIHLVSFPVCDAKKIDSKLESSFEKALVVVQTVLSLRESSGKKLRWPLRELVVVTKSGNEFSKVISVLSTQCNVKKVSESKTLPRGIFVSKETADCSIFLDTSSDAALEEEWEFLELRRRVQEERKKAGLSPAETAVLAIVCSDDLFLKKFGKQLEKEARVKIVSAKGEMAPLLKRSFFFELNKK